AERGGVIYTVIECGDQIEPVSGVQSDRHARRSGSAVGERPYHIEMVIRRLTGQTAGAAFPGARSDHTVTTESAVTGCSWIRWIEITAQGLVGTCSAGGWNAEV